MKKIIIILLLFALIAGCAKQEVEKAGIQLPADALSEGKTQPEEVPEIPPEEMSEEKTEELKEENIQKEIPKITTITNPLNVPRVNTAAHFVINEEGFVEEEDSPALCYLGAFAMLALYDDSSLDLADVIAYSGIGVAASYDSRAGLLNKYKEKSIILAAQNLGYDFVLGVKSGGKANSHLASFTPSASKVKYFKDEEEAFNHLKQIIDSGKPAEVHLDIYYVIDDFRKISEMWVNSWDKGHYSHFMAVTGYDDNYVYINDPTDPDLGIKNMKTPVKNFLEAWKNGDKVTGAQLGPYWMLYINKKSNKKSVNDIISWDKEISSDSASQIRKASRGDSGELGVGRKEFSQFLERNSYKEAAKLYQESVEIYLQDPEENKYFQQIADKEEQARGLLK